MVLLDPRELGISIKKKPASVLAFQQFYNCPKKKGLRRSRIRTCVIREVCAATAWATPSGGGTSSLDIIATGVVSGEECRMKIFLKSCPNPAGSKFYERQQEA
jgi:hypothetical protein